MAIVGAPQYISHVYLARHARSKVSYSSSSTCSFKRNNALFRHLEIQDEQGLLGFGLPIYQHPMESNLTLAAQMLRDAYQGPPIAPMRRFLDPLDVEGAYAVQALNTRHWLAEGRVLVGRKVGRSEEHTSELQSLMRISYAVFCL